jgi:hypothetical protein
MERNHRLLAVRGEDGGVLTRSRGVFARPLVLRPLGRVSRSWTYLITVCFQVSYVKLNERVEADSDWVLHGLELIWRGLSRARSVQILITAICQPQMVNMYGTAEQGWKLLPDNCVGDAQMQEDKKGFFLKSMRLFSEFLCVTLLHVPFHCV